MDFSNRCQFFLFFLESNVLQFIIILDHTMCQQLLTRNMLILSIPIFHFLFSSLLLLRKLLKPILNRTPFIVHSFLGFIFHNFLFQLFYFYLFKLLQFQLLFFLFIQFLLLQYHLLYKCLSLLISKNHLLFLFLFHCFRYHIQLGRKMLSTISILYLIKCTFSIFF